MINTRRFYPNTKKQLEKCFCTNPKQIENYARAISDDKHMWDCHHRLETRFSDGTLRPKNAQISKEELIELGMYYNRPAEELIFLTRSEHLKEHQSNKGTKWTEEQKKKHSELLKGKPNVGGDRIQGKKWFNNGYINVREYDCPPGFLPGRIYFKRKPSLTGRKKVIIDGKIHFIKQED